MAVHHCALFCNNSRFLHERAVRRIAKYLLSISTHMNLTGGTRRLSTCGVVYKPDEQKGINCYVDANFSGGWSQSDSDNAETFMSRTGYVIMYV